MNALANPGLLPREAAMNFGWTHPLQARVDALVGPELDDAGAAAALATGYALLGPPVHAWLVPAAGVEAADAWWGQPLERWVARLRRSGQVPRLDELLAPRADERRSPHAIVPARAALVRYLRQTAGDDLLRGLWSGTSALPDAHELEPGFEAWLDGLVERFAAPLEAARSSREIGRSVLWSGPQLVTGAGVAAPSFAAAPLVSARGAGDAFEALFELGGRAVCVETFAALHPDRPELGGARPRALFGPLEGDVALAWTLASARELGLRTLLKPHLLEAPGSTYSGSLLRGDQQDWELFFDDYARFLEHFGLLGELLGCDALCVGAGIRSAVTLDPSSLRAGPEEAGWKLDGWKLVLERARGAFDGALTYATAWPQLPSDLRLWTNLDAVGLDVFLAPPADASGNAEAWVDAQLSNVLDEIRAVHREHDKPVVLTAVGFRADEGTSAQGSLQARLFDVLARRLERERPNLADSLGGVFLWRWSIDGHAADVDYVFRGRPAEEGARRILELR